jgi:hypothetical protein
MQKHKDKKEAGNVIIEFAVVVSFLVPMLAASFTIGMSMVKGIQSGNVCRDADVLFVRSQTDPQSGIDLSQATTQSIVIRAAQGLGMKAASSANPDPYNPDPNGKGVVILTKVLLVGAAACAAGNPAGHAPWTTANCPNYDTYVMASRINIGNNTTFGSRLGHEPSLPQTKGNFTAADIANTSSLQIPTFATIVGQPGPAPPRFLTTTVCTSACDTYALISEMFVDISSLNLFSTMSTPILYHRNIS